MASPTLYFLGNAEDQAYLPRLKPLVGTASVFISLAPILTWAEVKMTCEKRGATGIISTNRTLLAKLTGEDKPLLDSYAGSYFRRDNIEVVFVDPLPQLVSLPYGAFTTSRYISKLAFPERWNSYEQFSYTLGTPDKIEDLYALFSRADCMSVDIETTKTNLAITSIAYTAISFGAGNSLPRLTSFVLELDSEYSLVWMRKFNALPVPKITQNGKYDCSYLLRYNAPLSHWFFDTATAMHCWYAELPRDLATLSAFFHREGRYWKDMAAGDHATRLEYNCRDTFATAIVWLEWCSQAPKWAKDNYLQEFPLLYPCLLAEMTGIKRDLVVLDKAFKETAAEIATESAALDKMLAVTNFNVYSPIQMKALLRILGCSDLSSVDEKNLNKAAFRHPLIARIVDKILAIRGLRKLNSTYLTPGKELNGTSRILYSLNPHGTDTGRLASKEHHFWCGLQIQNIPRGYAVKQTLIADDGFRLAESDLEQAESRDTAHVAGSESLISAVSGTRDFHSVNASAFFGVSYESIYSDTLGKTLNKVLRDLAKRVNHGANYNMGANVLVETMGLVATYKAAAALGLPKAWLPKQIAQYLLDRFHATYPDLKKTYYTGIVAEIKTHKMLVSKVTNSLPWTRYCFSDPAADKRALNAYVAHAPQSLNAMTLNKAFMKVFYEIALRYPNDFRLLAQIHDSILFEFRVGFEFLAEQVKTLMEIPVTVVGYDGKTRTFTVPAALKAGKDGLGSTSWATTE